MPTDNENPADRDAFPADVPEPVDDADMAGDELRRISEEISALYPPPRLGTELVLLEVNPHRAHAYWNVDVEDFRDAQKRSGLKQAPMVLRVYDVTDVESPKEAQTSFDIEVQGLQGHWYIDLWKDGRTHVADLGFRKEDSGLVALARSNPVSTPPAAESGNYSTLALDTGREGRPERKITDLVADPKAAAGDDESDRPAEPAPAPAAAKIFAMPAMAEMPARGPMRQQVDEIFDSSAAPASQPWHAPETPPARMTPSTATEHQDWPSAHDVERAAQAMSSAEPPRREPGGAAPSGDADRRLQQGWPSAEELARHVPDTGGRLEEPPPPAPEPDAPRPPPVASSPMPLDSYVSLSSFEHGRREVALEVNVELHIYGRAKPGTELTLYGQPVPLRPDGTFSVHKPLPQGAVVLPLLAVDPPPPESGA